MNWISVKDKLPGYGTVLVYTIDGYTLHAEYYLDRFDYCCDGPCYADEIKDVTHWIKLEDIPKP